jgi:hypothetical protein
MDDALNKVMSQRIPTSPVVTRIKARFLPAASSLKLDVGTICRIMNPHPAGRPTPAEKIVTMMPGTAIPEDLVLWDKHQSLHMPSSDNTMTQAKQIAPGPSMPIL